MTLHAMEIAKNRKKLFIQLQNILSHFKLDKKTYNITLDMGGLAEKCYFCRLNQHLTANGTKYDL